MQFELDSVVEGLEEGEEEVDECWCGRSAEDGTFELGEIGIPEQSRLRVSGPCCRKRFFAWCLAGEVLDIVLMFS